MVEFPYCDQESAKIKKKWNEYVRHYYPPINNETLEKMCRYIREEKTCTLVDIENGKIVTIESVSYSYTTGNKLPLLWYKPFCFVNTFHRRTLLLNHFHDFLNEY